ncbi:MAG: acyl-[acyl-carrier-protein]--UDP-N-acetylglucosamine O-acyltransferase [Phycisphaerae bacterium]|nr:acyl-[acyl-carrier-protein]--UDP-N-acetylglucosamine O-acyltransferase [Phycisphaerae bacterium]
MTIHSTAIIDPSATIADSATIGPWCVIGPDVEIGADTELMNHVTVQKDTVIGRGNRFYPYTGIGIDPQDRKYDGERTTCEIGDENEIREHVTIHRGTGNGGGVTRIGHRNLLMVGCHVAHDCRLHDETVIANQVMLAGHVCVHDGASIGGGAGIHHFATVGSCAFVGGLARISRDVPPFMIVEGHPAEVRAVNSVALVRRGFSESDVEAIKDAFRRLFRNNGSTSEQIGLLRSEHGSVPAIQMLCDALDASAEGTHGRALEAGRADDKWAKVEN